MIFRGCVLANIHNTLQLEGFKNQEKLSLSIISTTNVFNNFRKSDRVILDLKDTANILSGSKIQYTDKMNIQLDGYATIKELSPDIYKDIYAVVISCMPLCATRGTDYLFTLELADETATVKLKIFINSMEEIKKFLEPEEYFLTGLDLTQAENFNRIFRPGDILLLRNIKLMRKGNTALIHKSCNIRKICSCTAEIKEVEEYRILKGICDFYKSIQENRRPNKKKRKIEELTENVYFDIIGRITYLDFKSVTSTVCLIDYTFNNLVSSEMKGSYSLNMLLYIKVYGRFVALAKNLKIGDICLFQNVKINAISKCLLSHMSESQDGNIAVQKSGWMVDELLESEGAYTLDQQEKLLLPCELDEAEDGRSYDGHNTCIIKNKYESQESGGGECVSNGYPPSSKDSIKSNISKNAKEPDISRETIESNKPKNIFSRPTGRLNEKNLNFTILKDINAPGIYYSKVKVEEYNILDTEQGKCLEIIISDSFSAMRVIARQRLTKELNKIAMNRLKQLFWGMILRTDLPNPRNFLVSAFLDDGSMNDFMEFHCVNN